MDIVCRRLSLDVSVAALAHVYFERVVLQGAVNKTTRKPLAAACVVLSVKTLVDFAMNSVLPALWPVIDDVWGLSRPQVGMGT